MKIFFSWQSDIAGKFNRSFIKDCLERAAKQLDQEEQIEDAVRVDHDTKDISGSPDIFSTILKKIDECDIFIGDVTFVARTPEDRLCPNPNVLIELGYALKCLGDERVINIMNVAFGMPSENLPFDLAHKRWPIQYELSETSYSNREEVRNKCVASLKSAIFPFLKKAKVTGPTFTSNADRVRHRERLRKEFEEELLELTSKELVSDMIIRDVDRVDGYPQVEESERISSWFRVGLLETYTRGIRVFLQAGSLTSCDSGYRYTDHKNNEKGELTAFLVGEIPYDSIEVVNWKGDEYYYYPHIYCYFNHDGEPYERFVFCSKVDMGDGHFHYKDISEYEIVQKNSENHNVDYFA